MLQNCCIVWPLPKIFYSGLPADNKRIIPVTNIAESLEYVSLPHHDDVTKPSALSAFVDGLAELGIDKGLIKNKKLASDLIEKEKGYRNNENTFENESNVESSSDREEEGEEIASVNGSEDEDTPESDNDTENDSEETESISPETYTIFHSGNLCEHFENKCFSTYQLVVEKLSHYGS